MRTLNDIHGATDDEISGYLEIVETKEFRHHVAEFSGEQRNLRDWFAGMALQGLLASGHFTESACDDNGAWMTTHLDELDDETLEETHKGRRKFDFPEAAWRCADAMLAARKENP